MNFFAFSALINCLTSFLLGAYTLIKGYKNPLKTNYAFFAFSVSFWSFGYFFWQLSTSFESALLWSRVLMGGAVLVPVSYFNFSLWLTNKFYLKKWESILSYLLGGTFLILNFTPLMVKGVESKLYFNFWPTPGVLFHVFLLVFFFYVLYSLLIMYFVFRRASGHLKTQIMYVFLGTAIGFAGGSTNYFLWYDIPIPPIANILVSVYPLLLAYAITKHHLMDISVIISRTVAELLTILFHGTIYLGLVWLFRSYVSTAINWIFLAGTVLYGILVGQTHQSLRLFLQTTSDKVFLRGKYDYYKELSNASSRVGEKLSLAHILEILYETFHDVVEISNPRIFLPENFTEIEKPSCRYVVYSQNTYFQHDGDELKNDSPLVSEMVEKREPLHDVKSLHAALIIPCLLENRLIAFFALGPKLSEDHYTDEDLRLLKILANQVAITLDHTRSYEKIKADLDVAERQLERSQRLASLGTLTAGVTHEIRNPLTVIRTETERIANQPRGVEDLVTYRDLILKHIDRIGGIVQRMLGLAKEKDRVRVDLQLNDVLNTTLQFFKLNNITVTKEMGKISSIKGDPEEIQEMFVNLVQNAIEAMPNGGNLKIKTYQEDNRVVAEVSDTGKGIPEELKERIFDPFFSTRHEGTGLGLSIIYRIVREHGGDIKVDSELGKGSTFKIIF